MRFRLVTIFCISIFSFLGIHAQPSQNIVIDKVNTKELTNSFISSLYQDQKGYLWVGTIAGLNRYDGYSFVKFRSIQKDSSTLSNPSISCMLQMDPDKIFIGTRGGLNIYNYKTNTFSRVKVDTTLPNYKRKMSIYCIVSNKSGEKYVGSGDGLLKYNPQNNSLEPINYGKETFLNGWTIQSLCIDRHGNLWAGAKKMENGSLQCRVFKCNVERRKYVQMTTFSGGSAGHPGISEDYLGNIWVAVDDGLVMINPSLMNQTYYKAPGNFYSNISYTHTKDNVIWQCFWSFGLTAFDIDKKEFKVYSNNPDNPKSLISNKCWALCKDDNDILWIGSDVGLQKLTSNRPSMEIIKRDYQDAKNSFLSNRVSAVYASRKHNNMLLVGIDGEGFSIYNKSDKKSTNYGPTADNKNQERFVNQFFEDTNGDIYIAGQYNFQKITVTENESSVKSFLNYQEHYSSNIIQDPTNQNVLWIGGINEVFAFNKANQFFEFIKEPGGVKTNFLSGFTFNNLIYFTHQNGILVLNPVNKKTEDVFIADAGNLGNSLQLNDSTFLISSQYSGLIKFFPKSKRHEIVYRNGDQVFPEINKMILYKNFIWMATNHGVLKFNPVNNECSEITMDDGLPTETINGLDVLEGYLYIASHDGLIIFNPDFQVSHFNIPRVEITSINGIGHNLSQLNILNGGEIKLKEEENSFQINFALLDFNLPEKNSFKYKLLPIDRDWKNIGNRHTVYFNDLAPGTYVFELMGANADNNWTSEPFRVTIRIVPPFYKSKWFYYLSVSLVAISIFIFILLRFRAGARKRLKLEKIISDRTAEIQEKRAELMDSISYAERIQKAIFVGEDILHTTLSNSFILYKPKDKVSGDFYWIGRYKDLLIVFAGDCTGHGVPGAMLSIVGTSLLNKIVYEENLYLPGEILTRLNHLFYNQLNLKEKNIRDGMDASVLTLNLVNHSAYFSGAKNDGYYIANNTMIDLKAHRYSIGENDDAQFKTTFIEFEPNRIFYLFSDGVKDQFGGPQNKKFSSVRFRQTIFQAADMPFEQQSPFIYNTLKTWQGESPQTDDLLVIGFKF